MFYVLFTLIALYTLCTLAFAITSFGERCARAGVLGSILFLIMLGLLGLYGEAEATGLLSGTAAQVSQGIMALILLLFTVSLFVPLGRRKALSGTKGMAAGPPERINQKDTAFSIAHVGGYGPAAARNRWALQSKDPFGGFFWTQAMGLRYQVDGKVASDRKGGISPGQMTRDIKDKARYLGADLVGITTVKEDFTYTDGFSYEESKLEVGPAVTTPVDLKHKYAICLGKGMDYDVIKNAPMSTENVGLGEIGKSYHEVAQVACALAAYIRQLGYPARAHHLRNDQILHVPHGVDAGLGEQGRHSYLVTARHGPRVRTAVVTTDLELVEDTPVDIGMQDFCEHCRLCELNCPCSALPAEKELLRGYRRWRQDQNKCFNFWVSGANTFGCTLCMNSCPWNKPPTLVHRISALAASRSIVARRLLYWFHLLFYGKRFAWKRIPLKEEVAMPTETASWKR